MKKFQEIKQQRFARIVNVHVLVFCQWFSKTLYTFNRKILAHTHKNQFKGSANILKENISFSHILMN